MRFPRYENFESEYQEKYGARLREFPMVERCFSLELRNFLGGYESIARRNLTRRAERYPPVELLLRLACQQSSKEAQVLIDLPGFPTIRRELEQKFAEKSIHPLSEKKILGIRAPKVVRKLATMGAAYSRASRLVAQMAPESLFQDSEFLARLELELEKNFDRVLLFLENQKICVVLSQGDSKPHERMICAAAQQMGIPFIVLSHGYVSEPNLISIAPLYANAFVAWTEGQKAELAASISKRAADFHCFGFPSKIGKIAASAGPVKNVIMAWEPIVLSGLLQRHTNFIKETTNQIRSAGYVPLFRAHPKETNLSEIKALLAEFDLKQDIQPLRESLASAHGVVSSNSSVLTEAAFLGLRAYQISELAQYEFEGAIRTPLRSLGQHLESTSEARNVGRSFDTEAFFSLIQSEISKGGSGVRRT